MIGMARLWRRLGAGLALCLCITLISAPVWAVQPDEVMQDPAQEERARDISRDLRCLVCRNESIDESNAELARDLRLLVRERIRAGDSNVQVVDFVVDRYGEYVLLRPMTGGSNFVLWASGPMMLLIALGLGGLYVRRRSHAPADTEAGLDSSEMARLKKILDE